MLFISNNNFSLLNQQRVHWNLIIIDYEMKVLYNWNENDNESKMKILMLER